MRKRLFAICMCFGVLAWGLMPQIVSANIVYDGFETAVPYMTYIQSNEAHLSISAGGTASIECYASGKSGTVTSMHLDAELQQYKDGKWQLYKRYSVVSKSSSASISQSVSVEKGYSYRLKGTAYAYVTTLAESGTAYSAQVWY